jgi:glycosyl transferase family 25
LHLARNLATILQGSYFMRSGMQIVTLPDYFGAAFVINLNERIDRRRDFEEEIRPIWGAIPIYPAAKFTDPAGFETAGWRGCFHSHLGCLRYAHAKALDSILIMEDDLTLCSSLPRLTPAIIEKIRLMDWDLLYFGHERTGDIPRANGNTSSVTFIEASGELLCAHFYAVRGRIISRLIEHFERNERTIPPDDRYGPMLPDGALNTFRRYNPDIKTYLAVPKLGWQRPSRSDLTARYFDRFRVLRPIIDRARSAKHRLIRRTQGFKE